MRALTHAAQQGLFAHIARFHPELTAFRRDLHAHPELGFEEVRTASRVVEALKLTRVDEVHTGIAKTGVVAVIRGRSHVSGRSIALRADMDALPMREENDFAWRSGRSGLMHGCGHDGHVTMLVGAARYLAETRRFDGTVYLVFQPGEEGFAGAKAMIDDGLFERFPAQAVYAMHNWPHLPAGQVGVAPGPMMAAADRIEITVTGKGGHGAHPHLAVDPVLVSAHIITAAQSLVSRNVSPFDNAVLSICAVHGGDVGAMSVIPRQAKLVGTVRTFRPQVQEMIEERLARLVESVAMGLGATATLDYQRVYPATVNSVAEATFAARVAESLVGPEQVLRDLQPSMGAEDFSFMLQVKPGAYLRIGQGREANDPGCFLHSGRYDFNDEILPLGSALFASLAEQAMPLNPGGGSP
ncbi:M20 family metallopeptidase [Aquabacterium sp. A7-Y]|uniref:M20 aminoacylase family protein n=1 Tax=Aquabacterium sp. A7-Y TaxID=1349605 RepID=UPI00223CB236|nr:M20 aminoacylase family protein [Aquabacterium sp. A7-Y]MCW7539872.1 M20 family metallopeptidase [Aquabacterium sp. A7-Y]